MLDFVELYELMSQSSLLYQGERLPLLNSPLFSLSNTFMLAVRAATVVVAVLFEVVGSRDFLV